MQSSFMEPKSPVSHIEIKRTFGRYAGKHPWSWKVCHENGNFLLLPLENETLIFVS